MENSSIDPKQIIAYFDFDGTITNKDTFLPYLIYAAGIKKFLLNLHLLLPILLLYALKIITNEVAKERTLTVLLKGFSHAKLEQKAKIFARKTLDTYIKPEIYSKLEYHLEHGHSVALVSANLSLYLDYWAKRHHIDYVIATELEFVNEIFSGKLKTRNCYGIQKVLRVKEFIESLDSQQFKYSYGYGNSRGDYELLDYVDEAYWISSSEIISWAEHRGLPDK